MKRRGSFGGGGAAWDVESERCRLAKTVFLGAIVVTGGSKSKKKCTQEGVGDKGEHLKMGGGKKIAIAGI